MFRSLVFSQINYSNKFLCTFYYTKMRLLTDSRRLSSKLWACVFLRHQNRASWELYYIILVILPLQRVSGTCDQCGHVRWAVDLHWMVRKPAACFGCLKAYSRFLLTNERNLTPRKIHFIFWKESQTDKFQRDKWTETR